jgi:hypothetical protein
MIVGSTECIALGDWTKRKRAMVEMLKNPKIPKHIIPSMIRRADVLANRCVENKHPICAQNIRDAMKKKEETSK